MVERTDLAARAQRFAYLASMADEEHVELVDLIRRDEALKSLVGLVWREARLDEAEASRDAIDVGIHRQGGEAEG